MHDLAGLRMRNTWIVLSQWLRYKISRPVLDFQFEV